jgi:hypothetical protein
MDGEVTPVERLARRLCKTLPQGQPISRRLLETMLAEIDRVEWRRSHSARARRHLRRRDGDVDKAIDLAALMGWMRVTPEACMLTEAGALFARRTRIGVQRRRQIF